MASSQKVVVPPAFLPEWGKAWFNFIEHEVVDDKYDEFVLDDEHRTKISLFDLPPHLQHLAFATARKEKWELVCAFFHEYALTNNFTVLPFSSIRGGADAGDEHPATQSSSRKRARESTTPPLVSIRDAKAPALNKHLTPNISISLVAFMRALDKKAKKVATVVEKYNSTNEDDELRITDEQLEALQAVYE